jgi:allantoin racemase
MNHPLLLNPNSNVATTESMLKIVRRWLPDALGWTAPDGPEIITSPEALTRAAAAIAAAPVPASCPGVIIAAFGDPGRESLAQRLAVPVVGIGESSARAAAEGGRRFAVVTHTPDLQRPIGDLMCHIGGSAYLGCWLAAIHPEATLPEADMDAAFLEAIYAAHNGGADVVIIGGGPLADAAARLVPLAPCPIIEPVPEAARRLLRRLIGP